MKHQAIRRAALMLSVLLATVVPTQAGTITLADVAQIFVNGQTGRPTLDYRLRSVVQSGSVPVAGATTSSAQSGNQSSSSTGSPNGTQSSTSTATGTGSPSLIDTAQTQEPSSGSVETIDLGDVTGTVCDCGEIPVPIIPGGGFPKWPLLALAGIPLFFIPGGDDNPPNFPPSFPTPGPPGAIPEPATILLFGSSLMALGAGARRRRRRSSQLDGQAVVTSTAEEV